MANWSRMSYARLVSAAHTLYTNARANPDIVAEMTEFGYTAPDDYDAGLALLADAHAATGTLAAEHADALAATAASDRATDHLQARFIADRRRARRAHPSGTDGYSALHLAGDAPRAEADLIQAAATFYNTLTSRPDLAAPILTAALTRAGIAPRQVDEVICSTALGPGGNPARSIALDARISAVRLLPFAPVDLRRVISSPSA